MAATEMEEALPEGSMAAEEEVSLRGLTAMASQLSCEQEWEKFHSPRNLLLALVGKVGDISETFQWKGEVPKGLPDWSSTEKEHLGEQMSDVLMYLLLMADICQVDLGEASLRKLNKNARKYPADRCKGSSKKYTYYQNSNNNGGSCD